jgi:hypothetical protein
MFVVINCLLLAMVLSSCARSAQNAMHAAENYEKLAQNAKRVAQSAEKSHINVNSNTAKSGKSLFESVKDVVSLANNMNSIDVSSIDEETKQTLLTYIGVISAFLLIIYYSKK